jgi:hypothetical protein
MNLGSSISAALFWERFFDWDAKQYSRIWGLSIGYHYILYLKELTGLIRYLHRNFHSVQADGTARYSQNLFVTAEVMGSAVDFLFWCVDGITT